MYVSKTISQNESEIVGHRGWMSGQQDQQPQCPTVLQLCAFMANHSLCDITSTDRQDALSKGN